MSTALELKDPANLAMTAKAREASALAQSDLVPQAYRNNAANVMVAMELAHRIGASVMAVMQNLHVIQGKPSFSSSFLIGCVNSCGRFSPLRFRFDGEGDEFGCRAVAKDVQSGEECVGPKVTMKMATLEGWTKKNGSKWLTMPELMFTYRAAAFWTRVFAPELSLGMHTTDEYEDMSRAPVQATVTPGPRPTRPFALQAIVGDAVPEVAPDPQGAPASVVESEEGPF